MLTKYFAEFQANRLLRRRSPGPPRSRSANPQFVAANKPALPNFRTWPRVRWPVKQAFSFIRIHDVSSHSAARFDSRRGMLIEEETSKMRVVCPRAWRLEVSR